MCLSYPALPVHEVSLAVGGRAVEASKQGDLTRHLERLEQGHWRCSCSGSEGNKLGVAKLVVGNIRGCVGGKRVALLVNSFRLRLLRVSQFAITCYLTRFVSGRFLQV
jgi:hypothetical protein